MKNLILLLTSLLLAGVANAGFAEFTTDTPQVEEWQDFEVAHGCGVGYIHTPSADFSHTFNGVFTSKGGVDGRGHRKGFASKCEHKWKINKCAKENRTINLWADSNNKHQSIDAICGKKCSFGEKPGRYSESIECVPDKCPEGTVWQPQHQKCTPVPELVAYCKNEHGQQYNLETRKCETCPAGSFPQYNGCLTLKQLNDYCATVKSHFVYGVAQDACVSVFDLRKYCREEFDKGYNKDTAKCEVCPVDHFPQESGCVSKANLDKYCRDSENGSSYDPPTDACVCSDELPFALWGRQCVHVGSYCKKANKVWSPTHKTCRHTCGWKERLDAENICR